MKPTSVLKDIIISSFTKVAEFIDISFWTYDNEAIVYDKTDVVYDAVRGRPDLIPTNKIRTIKPSIIIK